MAATVETSALRAEFDGASGSLVRVCGRRDGVPAFVSNGGALWEVELKGGVKLTEQSLLKVGGRMESVDFNPAAQPVVSFVHDRKPMLARTDIPQDSPLDDGTVIAQYGKTKVYVNLGDVPRRVGPHDLASYGWKVEEVK